MANLINSKVARDATKSKDRETPVIIVRLYHCANVQKRGFVLIVTAQKM